MASQLPEGLPESVDNAQYIVHVTEPVFCSQVSSASTYLYFTSSIFSAISLTGYHDLYEFTLSSHTVNTSNIYWDQFTSSTTLYMKETVTLERSINGTTSFPYQGVESYPAVYTYNIHYYLNDIDERITEAEASTTTTTAAPVTTTTSTQETSSTT